VVGLDDDDVGLADAVADALGAWPRSVTQARVLRGEKRSPSSPLVKRKPTGSWASCGIGEALDKSGRGTGMRIPVAKICQCRAPGQLPLDRARRRRRSRRTSGGELLQALDPRRMVAVLVRDEHGVDPASIDSPEPRKSAASRRAEKPASRRIRAPPSRSGRCCPSCRCPVCKISSPLDIFSPVRRRRRNGIQCAGLTRSELCYLCTSMPTRKEDSGTGGRVRHAPGAFQRRAPALQPARGRRWNERTFGPCANENGHGHNYVLEVTVRGRPDPETGYVLDLGELKRILERAVVGPATTATSTRTSIS
jgi:hypothetical protein